MNNSDFNFFVGSVLIEVADRQTSATITAVEINEVCRFVQSDCPPTWIEMAEGELRRFGTFCGDSEDPEMRWFFIESSGVAQASRLRSDRQKPSLGKRVYESPFSKGLWDLFKIAFGVALGVAATKIFEGL